MTTTTNDGHHHHDENGVCNCKPTVAIQSLDEMDFQRGIWMAALDNEIDRIAEFIGRGETDRRDGYGYTALHYAARKNNFDICTMLIRAGANVNAQTNGGGGTPLHRAAYMGNEKIVKLLLDNGADAEIADNDGNTALHLAASSTHCSADVLRHLTEANSNVKFSVNKAGRRAIDLVPPQLHGAIK